MDIINILAEKKHQMNDNHYFNKKIIKLWRSGNQGRVPYLFSELKKGGLLFIGFNPSFLEKKLTADEKQHYIFNSSFQVGCEKYKNILQHEAEGKEGTDNEEPYPYFRPFIKIAAEHHVHQQDIDLFFIRGTNQKHVAGELYEDPNKKTLNTFAKKQLEIAEEVINEISPKVIVVANAEASKIIQGNLTLTDFEKKRGFQFLKLERTKAPIFFTSMLSGQRALDTGSLERLTWHIGRALQIK